MGYEMLGWFAWLSFVVTVELEGGDKNVCISKYGNEMS